LQELQRCRALRRLVAAAATASPIYGQDQERLDIIHATLQDELGAGRLSDLAERGRALTRDEVVHDTLQLLARLTA
jgi:hypothetical protein